MIKLLAAALPRPQDDATLDVSVLFTVLLLLDCHGMARGRRGVAYGLIRIVCGFPPLTTLFLPHIVPVDSFLTSSTYLTSLRVFCYEGIVAAPHEGQRQ